MKSTLAFILNILLAVSIFAQTDWIKHENNPVLDVGIAGSFDESISFHSVIFDEGIYKMWYTGVKAPELSDDTLELSSNYKTSHITMQNANILGDLTSGSFGYATSPDGLNWTKHEFNPIASNTNVETLDIRALPYVLKHGDMYKMWYVGSPFDGLTAHIGHATSIDGISWKTHSSSPVVTKSGLEKWDATYISIGTVIIENDNTYHLWYSGARDATHSSIGYAFSSDGINWVKHPNNPVVSVGASRSWDSRTLEAPEVIYDGTIYHMFYEGSNGEAFQFGYATSPDGITWTKYGQNPILEKGPVGSWDGLHINHGRVMLEDGTFKLLYVATDALGIQRIGYATSPLVTSVSTHNAAPRSFALAQSFPNPFNPSTTIHFTLSQPAHVALKIFNVAGQEVATLVDSRMSAGEFETVWNAGNMPSGVYVYQLSVGGFVESKKMILLK